MSTRFAAAPWDHQGTRFRLFPQPPFLEGFAEGECVYVSPPAGTVGPGPSDERMYAIYPVDKPYTYGEPVGQPGTGLAPPWPGAILPPAMPGPDSHFDHLEPGTPQFETAHLYGTSRFVLDVWEGYFGQRIDWHFGARHERMELVITPGFNNATMGYGYLEIGGYRLDDGEHWPFTLNFDVIGHEIGHSIVYPIVGLPSPDTVYDDYYGFHEAAADLIGLVASLKFRSVIDHVLAATSGNLYVANKLNRFGELTEHEQIREASNNLTLADFVDGWNDEHDLGQPLTGAVFDILVDIFHELLVERDIIHMGTADLSDAMEHDPAHMDEVQRRFDRAYAEAPAEMAETLADARDHVGVLLASAFGMLTPQLSYRDVGTALVLAERQVFDGRYAEIVHDNLAERGVFDVAVGPRLTPPDEGSHVFSSRTYVPDLLPHRRRKASYRERYRKAREMTVHGSW